MKDHAIMGAVLMPGTGFLELALAAGQRVGAEVLEELTLQAPLPLGDEGAAWLQVTVSEADADGRREFEIYSRPQEESEEAFERADWTCHALRRALFGRNPSMDWRTASPWRGSGRLRARRELDSDSFYERLTDTGYDYGPSFRGLRRAFEARWGSARRGPLWRASARVKHRIFVFIRRCRTRLCTLRS